MVQNLLTYLLNRKELCNVPNTNTTNDRELCDCLSSFEKFTERYWYNK